MDGNHGENKRQYWWPIEFSGYTRFGRKEDNPMDTTTLIRIIAGVLAVAVLAFVIYRRKHAKV
jgi:hypothetical protein